MLMNRIHKLLHRSIWFFPLFILTFSLSACTKVVTCEDGVHKDVSCDESPLNGAHKNESLSSKQKLANRFFIGQDLGAIRQYVDSDCCVAADGATAYVGLYNVLSPELDFGGLGLNIEGEPDSNEGSWGAGPVSAYKTATEFGVRDLAIGLFIAENDRPNALKELIAGEHDNKIKRLARLFQYVPGKVFLRIGYEFDGVWNVGHEAPEVYIAAWRHIVDVLRAEGAENLVTVWQASASPIDDVIEKKHEDISVWYPGDDYVDWIGLSWFISPDEVQTVAADYKAPTARQLADEVITFARQHAKPVMVAEASPQGFDLVNNEERDHSPIWDGAPGKNPKQLTPDEIWDSWFEPFFQYLESNDDVIDAISYINCNWEAQPMWGPPYESGYWGDTRLNKNDSLADRWNERLETWRNRD